VLLLLQGGLVFTVNTAQARQLLSKPTAPVLAALGKLYQYDAAVGMNGRVWANSDASDHTILIANAIQKSEFMTAVQCEALVQLLAEG
jgi:exosome complex component RRP40